MEKYCLKIDFSSMGVVSMKKNQWAAIKILFQTSLSPLGVYSYMEVTKSVQDGIVGSTDRLSLNLTIHMRFLSLVSKIVTVFVYLDPIIPNSDDMV